MVVLIKIKKIGALTSKPYSFNARPWELKGANSFDIFDSFGSSIRLDYRDKEILRVLPRNSEWISDKVRFFYDGLKYKRFHYNYVRRNNTYVKVSVSAIFLFLKLIVTYLRNYTVQFKVGKLTDLETIFTIKNVVSKLVTKGIKSEIGYNIPFFTNIYQRLYYFNVSLLEETDCLLLIGLNLRLENPILNAMLRKQVMSRPNLKVFVFGTSITYNYYVKQVGVTMWDLRQILKGKHKLSFLLNNAKCPVVIFGSSFFVRQDSLNLFNVFSNFELKGIIFSHLVSDSSMLGGYELGINESIMTNKKQKELCMEYDILTTSNNGDKKKNLDKTLVIYQSSNFGSTALNADIIIPESVFIEKEAMFLTLKNGLVSSNKIYNKIKDAKHGWVMLQFFFILVCNISNAAELKFLTFLLKNEKEVKSYQDKIRERIKKRSTFIIKTEKQMLFKEPNFKFCINMSNFINVVNLYYNNDNVLTHSSIELMLMSEIEKKKYKNFKEKN